MNNLNNTIIIANALAEITKGRPLILLDDEDRENEADLIIAAEKITIEWMALFIRECSGIVCLCLTEEKCKALALPMMVEQNQSRFGTGFTVSIEARTGVTTGVSAADRVKTIQTAIAASAKPYDLARPGHVFPLRANPQGLRARKGHTEGAIELVHYAGLMPCAVICELMNPDGSMMRGAEIDAFAQKHQLVIATIEQVLAFGKSNGLLA